jgi:excisionase family DNA binding protein
MNGGVEKNAVKLVAVGRSMIADTERANESREIAPRLAEAREGKNLAALLQVDEVAALLQKTTKAIYSMIARGQLAGVTRIGRCVRVKRDELLRSLDHKCAPSRGAKR